MREPLFGAFPHHFSSTSRQAARIRGAPNPQQSLHPSTRANWIGAHRIRAAFRWKEMHEGAWRPFVHLFFSSYFQRRKNWRRMLPLLLFVVNSNPLWNNRLLLFPISKTEYCAKKRLHNQNKNKGTNNPGDFLLVCRNRIPVHPNYRKFGKQTYAK